MGLFRTQKAAANKGNSSGVCGEPWHDQMVRVARAGGAFPYVVEGFSEITDAVRRGHVVLLKREECEVSEGITIFGRSSGDHDLQQAASPMWSVKRSVSPNQAEKPSQSAVAVLRFDVSTARFVLQDSVGVVEAVQLTPKRLFKYVSEGQRDIGVALGA